MLSASSFVLAVLSAVSAQPNPPPTLAFRTPAFVTFAPGNPLQYSLNGDKFSDVYRSSSICYAPQYTVTNVPQAPTFAPATTFASAAGVPSADYSMCTSDMITQTEACRAKMQNCVMSSGSSTGQSCSCFRDFLQCTAPYYYCGYVANAREAALAPCRTVCGSQCSIGTVAPAMTPSGTWWSTNSNSWAPTFYLPTTGWIDWSTTSFNPMTWVSSFWAGSTGAWTSTGNAWTTTGNRYTSVWVPTSTGRGAATTTTRPWNVTGAITTTIASYWNTTSYYWNGNTTYNPYTTFSSYWNATTYNPYTWYNTTVGYVYNTTSYWYQGTTSPFGNSSWWDFTTVAWNPSYTGTETAGVRADGSSTWHRIVVVTRVKYTNTDFKKSLSLVLGLAVGEMKETETWLSTSGADEKMFVFAVPAGKLCATLGALNALPANTAKRLLLGGADIAIRNEEFQFRGDSDEETDAAGSASALATTSMAALVAAAVLFV